MQIGEEGRTALQESGQMKIGTQGGWVGEKVTLSGHWSQSLTT
jgi:hypothetical protein